MKFTIKSQDFEHGSLIPVRFTAEGEEISPHLEWAGAPKGTRQFALLCEDPDAPFPKSFVHWIVYQIPAEIQGFESGASRSADFKLLYRQGLNSKMREGFAGPLPPFFQGAHRYFFRLFALNEKLNLEPGLGRKEFVAALDGKVLAEAQLIGLYSRSPAGRVQGALKLAVAAAVGIGFGYLLHQKVYGKKPLHLQF